MRLSQNGSNNSAYKFRALSMMNFPTLLFALGYQKDGNATYQDSKKRAVSYYLNFGYAYDDRYFAGCELPFGRFFRVRFGQAVYEYLVCGFGMEYS